MEQLNPLSNVQTGQSKVSNEVDTGSEQPATIRKSRSLNERVGEAELLIASMSNNKDTLAPGGGGDEFLTQLTGVVTEIKAINQEQEKYKASLKTSTSALYLKLKQMDQLIRKGRRIVKNEMAQVRWVEFGIKATR